MKKKVEERKPIAFGTFLFLKVPMVSLGSAVDQFAGMMASVPPQMVGEILEEVLPKSVKELRKKPTKKKASKKAKK